MANRRRLNLQIQSSEEGAGIARGRTLGFHPQIQASDEGARVTRRRTRRLHPQTQASEDGAGMTRRRRRRSRSRVPLPAAAASLPDDDDLLREILVRLPPQPSSLPCAAAVCKRWRDLVTDPKFHRQFYAHHRNPPLLGVFLWSNQGIKFNPILDPPDCIPPHRFDLGCYGSSSPHCALLDCRHGLVLIKYAVRKVVAVYAPITGEHCHVVVPPDFYLTHLKGAVLCAADEIGHVHGGCHSSPFKVVLMSLCRKDDRQIACVYSLGTGVWGNLISTEAPSVLPGKPAVLVGNCLCWLSMRGNILEFDLDGNNPTVIRGPPVTNDILYVNRQIIQAEDGAIGYAILSYPHLQMWKRNVNGRGVDTLVPWKTIEMHTILFLSYPNEALRGQLLGYDEDTDVLFLAVDYTVYMVQFKSMQSKKLNGLPANTPYYPFKSFYTPGEERSAAVVRCHRVCLMHQFGWQHVVLICHLKNTY